VQLSLIATADEDAPMTSQTKPLASRKFLMATLVSIQNVPSNWDRDIVTFSALLDDGELADHILREFGKLPHEQRKLMFELAAQRGADLPLAA
jgi:hypothetical protein